MATTLPVACGETLFGDFKVTLGFDNDPRTIGLAPMLIWSCQHCDTNSMVAGETDGYDAMVAHARTHFAQVTPSGE